MTQDFIRGVRKEENLQNTYTVVSRGRKLARSNQWGKRSKVVIKNLRNLQ